MLDAARLGEADAFTWIFETYNEPIRNYVARMLGDRSLAEDLTQEIFIRVHQSLKSFNGKSLFTSWLFQIAKNRLIDEFRSRERRPESNVEFNELLGGAVEPMDDTQETVSRIWLAVAELDIQLKTALLLRDVAGLSYLEIAETLEISVGLVKWRIFKAREAIQVALADAGLSPAFPTRAPARAKRGGTAAAAA